MSDLRGYEPFTREGKSVFLEPHDRGVYGYFSPTIQGKKVAKIFATPERALVRLSEIYKQTNDKGVAGYIGNYPLPAMSVSMVDFSVADNRWDAGMYRLWKYTDGMEGAIQFQAPIPYDVSYQIDFWSKYREHLNALIEYMITLQNRFRFYIIPVDLGGHLGVIPMSAVVDGYSNNMNLEPGEPDDRLLRYTLNLRLQAWVFRNDQKIIPVVHQSEIETIVINDINTPIFQEEGINIEVEQHPVITRWTESDG